MNQQSLGTQLRGLVRLTRWREYIPFVVPLTILGALLATAPYGTPLDWRLVAAISANILAVAYAFMINDIEDAPDDARDPARAARNPVTSGEIGVRMGYAACRVVAAVTLILYAFGGLWVFLIGVATLLLSHFYSWRPVRLKAWPVTDVVSHSLMLSGLLLLAGYYLYHTSPGIVWLVAMGVTLFSAYGQFYNQLRDFEMDQAAGLRNTANLLGEKNTRRVMYLTIVLSVMCLVLAAIGGVFPVWLAGATLVAVLVSMMFRPKTDARGGEAADISGMLQIQGLITINVIIGIWLVWVVVAQIFPQVPAVLADLAARLPF